MTRSEKRRRTEMLALRLTSAERDVLRTIANRRGVTVPELIRQSLRRDVTGFAIVEARP